MSKSKTNVEKEAAFACPEFSLPFVALDGTEGILDNRAHLGQTMVLFLYPKDDTSGCTQEARDFSALSEAFKAAGVALYGLSKDPLKAHKKFISKYELKVPLISDESTAFIQALGAWQEKSLYGRKYMGTDRSTFVIDANGQVINTWRKVKIEGHAAAVLNSVTGQS